VFVFNIRFWKSVVGKLWATIIGLVAVVLLINSLLLGRFIDSNMIVPVDQERHLLRVASRVAEQISAHRDAGDYLTLVADLLHAQDAGLVLLSTNLVPAAGDTSAAPALVPLFGADALRRVLESSRPEGPVRFWKEDGADYYLAWAVPVRGADGSASGLAIVYQKRIEFVYIQQYYTKLFFIAIVIGFLLTTFFAFFLSTRITRPLLQLKAGTDAITRGDYTTRVPVPSSDEIGELARAYNHMAEWLERSIRDLRHEKELLSGILRSMTDAVVTFDAEGRVLLANPPGESLIEQWNALDDEDGGPDGVAGVARSVEAEGGRERGRRLPQPLAQPFRTAVDERREVHAKLHVRNEVFSVVVTPLSGDGENAVRGAVAVLRDVTEEYRLDRLRKDFVANVSHELRTPLSMLQGYSEALLDDIASTPEERREIARIIYDESVRMGRLVRDLLDLARMESGHMDFRFAPTDLRLMLDRVWRKFAVYGKEHGVSVELDMPADEPLTLEEADEDRLEQVLTNLLDNALRHTPSGKRIRISAAREESAAGTYVRVSVADEGQGIAAEDLPFIFERFYKADKARTRSSGGGTGLGLAIARQIVEAHGGRIDVESTVGQGSTFSILLPVRRRP